MELVCRDCLIKLYERPYFLSPYQIPNEKCKECKKIKEIKERHNKPINCNIKYNIRD